METFLAILAVVGALGVLIGTFGGARLQRGLERQRWQREHRARLCIELLADAKQRQKHQV